MKMMSCHGDSIPRLHEGTFLCSPCPSCGYPGQNDESAHTLPVTVHQESDFISKRSAFRCLETDH